MSDYARAEYNPINTDWYYTYIDIPNLDIIKKELVRLISLPIPKVNYNAYYTNIYMPNIVQCPTLKRYLSDAGLGNKLQRILFTKSDAPDVNHASPHVDSIIPGQSFQYSLNIPLIEADNSYTVWYKMIVGNELIYSTSSNTGWAESRSNTEEIARVRYTQPALMNTTILHSAEVTNTRRMIAGIRFWPELTYEEIQRLGVPVPLRQQT